MTSRPTAGVLERPVVHYRQKYSWDCGVSCVLMNIPIAHRTNILKEFSSICKEEGFNKSTWTIDLCYLLKRFNIEHEYCTVTIGVHPGYHGQTFYDKILHKDEERVNKRFQLADVAGIKINKESVTTLCLIDHLSKNGCIILLTNASLLHCDICKANKLATELRYCFPWRVSYHGHYIVLCGYNLERQKFMYRNPTFKDRVCMMSFGDMEQARKAYGTDEDIIFIYNN